MSEFTLVLRSIRLWPAFKFGVVLGTILLLLPGIAFGTLVWQGLGYLDVVQGVIEQLPQFSDDRVSETLSGFLYGISSVQGELANYGLDARAAAVLGGMLFITAGGVIMGLLTILLALSYNVLSLFSGGISLSVESPDLALMVDSVYYPQTSHSVPLLEPTQSLKISTPMETLPEGMIVAPPSVSAAPSSTNPVVSSGEEGFSPNHRPGLINTINPQAFLAFQSVVTRIGSAGDNDVVIYDLRPHHAEIRLEIGDPGRQYVLHDLSEGDTRVNSRTLKRPNLLKDGFVIQFGTHTFIFRSGNDLSQAVRS